MSNTKNSIFFFFKLLINSYCHKFAAGLAAKDFFKKSSLKIDCNQIILFKLLNFLNFKVSKLKFKFFIGD